MHPLKVSSTTTPLHIGGHPSKTRRSQRAPSRYRPLVKLKWRAILVGSLRVLNGTAMWQFRRCKSLIRRNNARPRAPLVPRKVVQLINITSGVLSRARVSK